MSEIITRIMRILYYMPIAYGSLIDRIDAVKKHDFRGELLYGVVNLELLNFEVIVSESKIIDISSKKLQYYYTKLFIKEVSRYDIIYSPYFQGLEWLIYMRALGIFKKKIVIWHHSPIERSPSLLGRIKQYLFFKGCDAVLFFSDHILNDSYEGLKNKKKMHVINWGPDLDYFDTRRSDYNMSLKNAFFMSGSDSRDFDSLVNAFSLMPQIPIDVYPPSDEIFEKYNEMYSNIHLHRVQRNISGYNSIALATSQCKCVMIISKPIPGRKLPTGLTSICEAVALGKPCIITDNPYFSDEIRTAGFAIFVKVGDVEDIRTAVVQLENDSELCKKMSEAALVYAKKYNSATMAKSLSNILHGLQ